MQCVPLDKLLPVNKNPGLTFRQQQRCMPLSTQTQLVFWKKISGWISPEKTQHNNKINRYVLQICCPFDYLLFHDFLRKNHGKALKVRKSIYFFPIRWSHATPLSERTSAHTHLAPSLVPTFFFPLFFFMNKPKNTHCQEKIRTHIFFLRLLSSSTVQKIKLNSRTTAKTSVFFFFFFFQFCHFVTLVILHKEI